MALFTLEQFKAALESGGIQPVTVIGQGREFVMTAERRIGGDAVFGLARQRQEPRRFVDLTKVVGILRNLGVRKFTVDCKDWRPEKGVR